MYHQLFGNKTIKPALANIKIIHRFILVQSLCSVAEERDGAESRIRNIQCKRKEAEFQYEPLNELTPG